MTLAWILALGFWHGVHPDHAAAAASMALRSRTPAWRAAIRIALGHGVALAAMAVGVRLLPETILDRAESWSTPLGGVALVVVGAALIVGEMRPHTHLHPHVHPHEALPPKGAASTTALGLTLGLAGARSLLVMLPAIAGPGRAAASITLYVFGIAAGCALSSAVVDLARRFAAGASRWVNLAGGTAALVSGAWIAWR